MSSCRRCGCGQTIEMIDKTSGFKQRVCPKCDYYESDSPAYAALPELFRDLGTEVLAKMQERVSVHGLTESEARGWIEQEPTFGKSISKPHAETPRSFLRSPRDKLTPYPL